MRIETEVDPEASMLSELARIPTEYVNRDGRTCHESMVRSFHTLRLLREMVIRRDSPETIEMVMRAIDALPGHGNPL